MHVSLRPLRPNITPSALQRMNQLAAKKAEDARLAAKQATELAAKKAQDKASEAALKRSETEDELLRRQAREALERFEAGIPLRRSRDTISTDQSLGVQNAKLHRARYLRETHISPWRTKSVINSPSPGSFKK